MSDWLATIDDAQAREVMGALVRVSTYCAEHDLLSAGAAIRQVSLATKHGVEYLDGGWQTLVSGLKNSAIAAGAELRSSATVEQLRRVGGRYSVTCDGERLDADAVVLAVGPQACAALAPWSLELASATRALVPIRAACLDVVLSWCSRGSPIRARSSRSGSIAHHTSRCTVRSPSSGRATRARCTSRSICEKIRPSEVRVELRSLNGLPSIVVYVDNAKPNIARRSVMTLQLGADGQICAMNAILARRKLARLLDRA